MSSHASITEVGVRRGLAAGFRLLAARRFPKVLRWASDPDAPDLRELDMGEVRLSIVSLQLSRGVCPVVDHGAALDRQIEHWVPLLAEGAAQVVESNDAALRAGSIVRGRFPVSTHVVIRPAAAVGSTRCGGVSGSPVSIEAVWRTGADRLAPALHHIGIDALERRVRRCLGRGLCECLHKFAPLAPRRVSSCSEEGPISVAR